MQNKALHSPFLSCSLFVLRAIFIVNSVLNFLY
uniref:Uncharacterized protein n=1 Tax=Arundo donax TaxID=35708 RepID=A0A0A9AKW2_ARUDO